MSHETIGAQEKEHASKYRDDKRTNRTIIAKLDIERCPRQLGNIQGLLKWRETTDLAQDKKRTG